MSLGELTVRGGKCPGGSVQGGNVRFPLISFRPYDGLLLREAVDSLRAMPAYGAAL